MKIEFHSNENIELHWLQLELNSTTRLKFN